MKRRTLLQDESAPASRRFRTVALLAASLGYVASLGALAEFATGIPDLLAVAAVLLAPIPLALGSVRLRRFLGFDPPPPSVLASLALVGIIVLAARTPAAALPGALCAIQGHLLVVLHDDRAAAWSPVVAVMQVLTALTVAPSAYVALLVPFVLVAAVAAQLLLLARVTRRSVAKRALGAGSVPESDAGADRRLLYALPLAGLLLFVALAAAPLATTPPWRLLENVRVADDGSRTEPPENRGLEDSDEAPSMSFSADMATNGIPMPAYEVLMEIVPRDRGRPMGDIGPLYLRGVVLSQFTDRGVRMRGTHAPTRYRDADDGMSDGFVTLREPVPPGTIQLEISQYPLPIEPHGWNLLFAVEPVYTITVPDVRYDPDRLLVSMDIPEDWFTYSVEVPRPRGPRDDIGRAPAVHPDARYVQLPPDSPGLQRIAEEGRRAMDGATSDHDRVRSLVRHFRQGFEYSLEDTTFAGAEGLAEFLDRKSGYCAQFASASVLMLREQGIPARVVTGFLATEWSHDQGAYQVRPRDTHAWFEVYFDGIGWVPFDSTAPDLRRAAIDADGAPERDAMEWAGEVLDSIGSLVTAPETGVTTRDLLRLLQAAPPGALRAFALSIFLGLVALIVVGFALRVLPGLRAANRRARIHMKELDDLYGKLLRALAGRGYHKYAAQTPREFARLVVHSGGVSYRPLGAITEDLYAARFGDRPLDQSARSRIDEFLAAMKQRA